MTNKINLVINLSILALLIYLAVTINGIKQQITQPAMMGMVTEQEFEYNIRTFLNNALEEAINKQEQ
tara:strand:- start:2033 stop:2233 length:201 start_codon:yes stop_codon:yes gene_type:complete